MVVKYRIDPTLSLAAEVLEAADCGLLLILSEASCCWWLNILSAFMALRFSGEVDLEEVVDSSPSNATEFTDWLLLSMLRPLGALRRRFLVRFGSPFSLPVWNCGEAGRLGKD